MRLCCFQSNLRKFHRFTDLFGMGFESLVDVISEGRFVENLSRTRLQGSCLTSLEFANATSGLVCDPQRREKKLAGTLGSYSRDKLPPTAQVAKQLPSSLVLA